MENPDPPLTGDLAAALHTCRAQLDLLLSHAPLGTWTTDRELKVTHAAGAALDRAGFDPRSLTGYTLPYLAAIHAAGTGQAGPLLDAHRQALLGAVTSLTVDWDGHAYQVRVEPLRDATGEIAGCMGLAVEIDRHTDEQAGQTQPDGYPLSLDQAYEELQVQNEELAAQQEELTTQQEELRAVNEALLEAQAQTEAERQRYQALFDLAPVAYLVTGPNGAVHEANRAAAALFDTPADALFGTSLALRLAREERETFAHYMALLRAGETERVQNWEARLRAGRDEPVTALITAAAVRDEQGGLAAIRWMLRDITERVRMLARLDFQARALDQVGDAVIAIDNDQRVTYLNRQAAAQYGLDQQAALGQPLDQLYRFEWPTPKDEAASYAALVGHGHWHGENLHITRSGKRLHADSTVTVLHDKDGRPQGMIATIRDVSERVAIRQSLEAERARLAAIIANAPEGIVVADAKAQVILTNPAAEQLYNRPVPYEQPYESHAEMQLVHPDCTPYDPRDLPLTRAALDGETTEEVEMAILWPDGQRRELLVNAAPIRDPGDGILGAVGLFQDVTGRRQAEEALRESRAKLEAALNSMTDAVFISDIEGRFIDFNDAFATYHRFRNRKECAKTLAEYPDILDVFFPDGTLTPLDMWAVPRALRGEAATNAEYILRRKDTGETWVGSYSFAPIRDPDGTIVGSVVVGRDITERKQAEEALRQSEARYRMLHESLRDGFVQVTMDGQVVDCNDVYCHMLGYSSEEIRSLTYQELTPERWHKLEEGIVRDQIIPRGYSDVYEKEYRRQDGTIIPVELRTILVRDPAGQPAAMWAIVRDITERKQAEEVLRESEERLRIALDGAQLGTFDFDLRTQTIYWDERTKQICGIPGGNDPDYGQAIEFIHPDDRAQLEATLTRAFDPANDGNYQAEFRIVRPDGTVVWNRAIGRVHFEGQGPDRKAVRQIGVNQDITVLKQFETDLRESEERLRQRVEEVETLMKVAPVAIWVSNDPRCDHIVGNPMADRFYEAAEEENVSANVSQRRQFFCHGRELAPEELPMQEAAARNIDIRNDELDVLLPSGRWLNMLGSASPLRDAQGQVRGAVGAFMDITERRQAEERVRRYADRLRVLHEMDRAALAATTAPEMTHSVLSQLPQLVPCVYASAVLCDLPERKMTLLAVHAGGETAPGNWHGPIDPTWEDIFVRLAQGKAYIVPDLQAESPLSPRVERLRSQGVRAHVYIPLLVQDRLIGSLDVGLPTPAPVPVEQIEILHEMADQFAVGVEQARLYAEIERYAGDLERLVRRRTHALEISEARFRAVFEEAGLGIMLLNRKGRVITSNPALQRILGRSAEDMHGQILVELIHPDEAAEAARRMEQLVTGEQPAYRAECRFPRSSGGMVEASVTFTLVRPAKSRSRFVVGLVEDITERRRTQQALIQSDRLAITGRLAASLAHEIGNPLQSVVGCLELIREGSDDGDNPAEYLEVAMDELDRATRILNQMRSLNRRSGGEREPANLNDLLEKTLLVSRKQCQNQRVTVTRQIDENLPALAVVSDHIQSVFLNMVINAVDAMPQGGKLHVGTAQTRSPRGVTITFADTGVGIPAKNLANIFEPFQTTKAQGLGLGLYISRQIVQEHRGRIEVESREGEGTTFTVWLPG